MFQRHCPWLLNVAAVDLQIAEEIVALHAEFERWMRGEPGASLDRVEACLGPDFTFVAPQGRLIERAQLMEGLRQSRGTSQLRIWIQSPICRWSDDVAALATYQEWHERPDYTTSRRATVLFEVDAAAPGGLMWRHVHETWLEPPPSPPGLG